MALKPVPDGFHTVTPYLAIIGAEKLVQFLKDAFGATEVMQPMRDGSGKIRHAEMKIGDSIVMIGEADPPQHQVMTAMLYLYVDDCDAVYKRAVQAGGKSISEPTDQFYGDRSGAVEDYCGNKWYIATHVKDVSEAELMAAMKK